MAPTPSGESLVYDLRLSSVVPASITGENKVHELTNMDLAMKLHYIRAVYFFNGDVAGDLSMSDFKKSLFQYLVLCYPICGRIRVSESGRPFIKCNDGGVRIVEAKCSATVEEWMKFNDSSLNDQLTQDQFLGPDLGFTPLVFLQFTRFKCGGLSLGLSWAHVLGDAVSASHFINMWGQFMAGGLPPHHLDMSGGNCNHKNKVNDNVSPDFKLPSSLHKVLLESAGGQWLISNRCKMQNHSFHVTAEQLTQASELAMKKPFEVISAMIWKSLAKVRAGKSSEPKNVTVCTRIRRHSGEEDGFSRVSIGNSEVTIWTVEAANFEADLTELAKLLDREKEDETSRVAEAMDEKDADGKHQHFILYGASLTFVNLEDVKIYGFELKGQKPVFASCNFSGVGDEGAVLVLPEPGREGGKDEGKDERGRMVNLILPEDQLEDLKKELQNEWNIC